MKPQRLDESWRSNTNEFKGRRFSRKLNEKDACDESAAVWLLCKYVMSSNGRQRRAHTGKERRKIVKKYQKKRVSRVLELSTATRRTKASQKTHPFPLLPMFNFHVTASHPFPSSAIGSASPRIMIHGNREHKTTYTNEYVCLTMLGIKSK